MTDTPPDQSAAEQLRNHLLTQMWDNSPDNMFVIRRGEDDFYMLHANLAERNSFELISGLPKDTPLRSILPPDIYGRVVANYNRCLQLNASISYEETENITRYDGKTTHWSTILSPIPNQHGEVEYLFGVSRNITSLKEAQKAAESANEVKTAFLANMSHEMRTPLNGVIGAAELIKVTDDPQQRAELCDLILNAAETISRQTSDILDYARIDSGNLQLLHEPFVVRDICRDVVNLLQSEADKKGLQLLLDIDDSIPAVMTGDGGRLKQILLNLLSNAVKFTHQGSVSLHVKLDSRLDESCQLRFTINDTGIGIHQDDLPRLFRPFSQLDHSRTRRYGGTGLGLAICRDLVHAKNGDIQVHSEPGKGSTFEVRLSYPASRQPVAASVTATPTVVAPAGLKLLLAEDNPTNQQIIRRILENAGIQVTLVENGQDAVAICQQQMFDIILMDWHMPLLDGLEATQQIRGLNNHYRHAPVVALTASALDEDRDKCLQAGMSEVLLKPVNSQQLLNTLARLTSAEETPE